MECSVTKAKIIEIADTNEKTSPKNLRKELHFSNTVKDLLATTLLSDQLQLQPPL